MELEARKCSGVETTFEGRAEALDGDGMIEFSSILECDIVASI